MPKVDLNKKQHPPAPPGFENDNSREVFYYKPEFNPIMRMVAAERVAQPHVQELLGFFDQFQVKTPPVSEDEEEDASGNSASKRKSGEPTVAKCKVPKNLIDDIEEEKPLKSDDEEASVISASERTSGEPTAAKCIEFDDPKELV